MKRVVRSLRSLTPRGFTLPEVLVTVAIIAVLASAVVPTVVNQLGKGDTPALQADLNSIGQAITAFSVATRSYPRLMTDLNTGTTVKDGTGMSLCPASSGVLTSAGNVYGSNGANWAGPYLSTKVQLAGGSSGAGHFKTAAYNLAILDTLVYVDGHVAVSVRTATDDTLPSSDVAKLKNAFDGTSTLSTTTGTSGLVRFTGSGSAYNNANPVYILVVPIGGSC